METEMEMEKINSALDVIRQHWAVLKLIDEMVLHDLNEFFIFLVLV